MVAGSPASNKSLEALRITRPKEKARRKRKPGVLLAMIILATAIGATTAYEVYLRTVGRPQTVQTIIVLSNRSGQPGVMLTGSGYVVTRHKYITIGTKILGQIVAEPIEEGQHVRIGDLLAQIDDRDYQLNSGRLPQPAIFQSPTSGWLGPKPSVRDSYSARASFPKMSMKPQLMWRRRRRP